MQNLYLAPKKAHFLPSESGVEAVLEHLTRLQILGKPDETGINFAPGLEVASLFSPEPWEELLPAELTFENLELRYGGPDRFLPERQLAQDFRARCRMCGDGLDRESLDLALEKLGYFPVDRFECLCPSCRNFLELKDIDFGQATAVARFWIYIEGVETIHLNHPLLDHLAKLLGTHLIVIPEVVEDQWEWLSSQ